MGEHFPFRGHDLSMDRFGNPHWSILLRLKNNGRISWRPQRSSTGTGMPMDLAMSALPSKAVHPGSLQYVCFVPIVLKKSFWGDAQNFSGLLMRFARGDMRDHIVSHKNDHGASYERYGVLQWRSRLKISFCEIFGVVQFSTFATVSARNGPAGPT